MLRDVLHRSGFVGNVDGLRYPEAAMPPFDAQPQIVTSARMAAGMTWTIWSNTNGGSITTYDKPAFRATWNNAGDFLARLGLQWNTTRTYVTYGRITAEYAQAKTGSAGGYSYVGVYGWSVSPCVEFYIVDDSYNRMPVNPGNTTNRPDRFVTEYRVDGGDWIDQTFINK